MEPTTPLNLSEWDEEDEDEDSEEEPDEYPEEEPNKDLEEKITWDPEEDPMENHMEQRYETFLMPYVEYTPTTPNSIGSSFIKKKCPRHNTRFTA